MAAGKTWPPRSRPTAERLATALAALRERFGERCATGESVRRQHGNLLSEVPNQPPDAVLFPQTTEEVAEIVRIAAASRVPVIPFGAGTSFEGHVNAPFGGVSIDTSRMKRIVAVNAEDLDCVVEAGVTRERAQRRISATPACSSRSIPAPTPRSAAWPRRAPPAPMRCATAR